MKRRFLRLVGTCILGFATHAAAKDCDPECDGPSAWTAFTAVTLRVTTVDQGWSAAWRGVFDHGNYDLRIEIDIPDKDHPLKGTLGMVAGRTMVSRGLELPRGVEIDYLDAPILNMRLLMGILGRVVPGGPPSVKKEIRLDHEEPKTGIRFATPSAQGYVAAPWKVSGVLEPVAGGAIDFDLSLSGGTQDPGEGKKGPEFRATYSGRLALRSAPVFDDAMSLEGWKTYGVGIRTERREGSTIIDYGAKPSDRHAFRTIGDLRRFVSEESNPGKADRSMDFTGFWKIRCEDGHGLRIMPAGSQGLYSVSFCGPGGCFEPGTYRPDTFITGDRRYKVVSASEIQVEGADGFTTYVRCSRDPTTQAR